MAMRFGHRICSHVRINNLSGVLTSLRGRPYCSKALSRIPEGFTASETRLIRMKASAFVLWGYWYYHYDIFRCRTMVENWKAEKKAQKMSERLNRENFKSEEAYLEMLDREAYILKEKLLEREMSTLDVKTCRRSSVSLQTPNVGIDELLAFASCNLEWA